MFSWDVLPHRILAPAGYISKAFIDVGATEFRSAAAWVNRLPYGRNQSSDNQMAVFHERRGTCSTKHALLKRLAIEQNLDVDLCLGIYYMTDANTPGIGKVLAMHNLPLIPEVHCFLRTGHLLVDVTRASGLQPKESITSFVYEETISPDQIGKYKNELHRRFLQQWIASSDRASAYTLDDVWTIREECIAALSERSPVQVLGIDLDSQTRCAHYHGPTDIIAVKMKCCGHYYACKDCHAELASHSIEVWPVSEWGEKAILCGVCRAEMSIGDYLQCEYQCVHCGARFNPKCQQHHHYYFAPKL